MEENLKSSGDATKSFYKELVEDIPLYKGKLRLIACGNVELLKVRLPDFPKLDIFATSYMDEFDGWQGYHVVLNPFSKDLNAGIAAHEAAHIVNMLFSNRGIEYDLDNDEPFCYLLEWVTNKIYSFITDCKLLIDGQDD